MSSRFNILFFVLFSVVIALSTNYSYAQTDSVKSKREIRKERRAQKKAPLDLPQFSRDGFKVSGGTKTTRISPVTKQADSLNTETGVSSEYIIGNSADTDSTYMINRDAFYEPKADTILNTTSIDASTIKVTETHNQDTTLRFSGIMTNKPDTALSAREKRIRDREAWRQDTTYYRHSPLFKNTISQTGVMFISIPVPGFSQLYNGDYWKIPILYATTGTSLYFGIKQQQKYSKYKKEYDNLVKYGADRELIDPVQTKMIEHNTWRQLFYATAAISYLYFLGDGLINYPEQNKYVSTATLLSTICPGAGQFYNKSYWKIPIFAAGFSAFVYVVDFNNRGYQRFKKDYEYATDDDPATSPTSTYDSSQMKNYRDNYRRNRDLGIILTAAFYLINIMDAHVDASLRDYDISDDLAFRMSLEPSLNTLYTHSSGNTNSFGLSFNITF